MKRDDSVFFFTLVDFLLTALFFGLVWFAVGRTRADREAEEQQSTLAAIDNIRKATGISDLTELTDRLTRLGPLSRAEEAARVVTEAGGAEEARKAITMAVEAGGVDSVEVRLARLRQREGAGLPHCLFQEINGRKIRVPLATVIATDSTMTFERETPELRAVLQSIGREFSQVRQMGFADFKRTFSRLRVAHPSCMYTLRLIENTRYVGARDALWGVFYMQLRHE